MSNGYVLSNARHVHMDVVPHAFTDKTIFHFKERRCGLHGDEAFALHLVSLLFAKDLSNHVCQYRVNLACSSCYFVVVVVHMNHSFRVVCCVLLEGSSCCLHTKARLLKLVSASYAIRTCSSHLDTCRFQRLRLPVIRHPLLCFLRRRQRPHLVFLVGELCAARCVFSV